jgi:Replication initiator protein, pSAM2
VSTITWHESVQPHLDPVTDAMVAGYLAKYATKGTEVTGHTSGRITKDTIDLYANAEGGHAERLIHACWKIGNADGLMFGKSHRWNSLHQWAHMLGFGGHFLTKGHHYSVTFGALRAVRIFYRRNQTTGPEHDTIRTANRRHEETTLIVGGLRYVGTGWKTTGDAFLANTAADLARRRREAGREDLAHEQGLTASAERQAA